jgi:AraC-like DNA-binding protein
VKHIHAEHATPLGAEATAQRAGMSVPAFHHHFKLGAKSMSGRNQFQFSLKTESDINGSHESCQKLNHDLDH